MTVSPFLQGGDCRLKPPQFGISLAKKRKRMKKKIVCFVLAAMAAYGAAAQDWQDALRFSQNDYMGTARSMGMGNAMSAIGGDLGSIGLNPAGSVVAAYSQFTVSPGFTFTTANAAGTVFSGYSEAVGLGDKVKTNFGQFKLPNFGLIMNWDFGRSRGLKRVSFGFAVNTTQNYTGRFNSSGVNLDNSFAGSLAVSADGYKNDVLAYGDWWASGDPALMPAWIDMTGYRAGMFNPVSGYDNYYAAVTEVVDKDTDDVWNAGPLYQNYGRSFGGSKRDVVFNWAGNVSDKFYFGINFGLSFMNYNSTEYWKESPDDPANYPTIEYDDGTSAKLESLRMKSNYAASGAGIYLKVGFIWRPIGGLRIGGAFQTPTIMNLSERYSFNGEVNMSGKYGGIVNSPEGAYDYTMLSPLRMNLGLAYSFGSLAVISADYEFTNFASTRFSARGSLNGSDFQDTNKEIKEFLGAEHQLRAGLEIKPLAALAIRAGYNLLTSGERVSNPFGAARHSFSLGAGYSIGSLFFDAAVRLRTSPKSYYTPYYYYYAPDASKYYNKVINTDIVTPEVGVKTNAWDAILTVGWRF